MRCRDFFIHLYTDATGDYWEFDHKTWEGIPAEPLRWRICAGRAGVSILSGCLDVDTDQMVWTAVEVEANLELAMLNVVERIFSEAGGMDVGGGGQLATAGVGRDEWVKTFKARPVISTDDRLRRLPG